MIRGQKDYRNAITSRSPGVPSSATLGYVNEIKRILKGFRHGGAMDGTLSGFRFTVHRQPRVAEDGNPGLYDTTPLALMPGANCPRIT